MFVLGTVVRMRCSLSLPNNLITAEQSLSLGGGEDREIIRKILRRLLLFLEHEARAWSESCGNGQNPLTCQHFVKPASCAVCRSARDGHRGISERMAVQCLQVWSPTVGLSIIIRISPTAITLKGTRRDPQSHGETP